MLLPDDHPVSRDAVVAVPEQMQQHARTVAGLADRVSQAWHATATVALDVGAYGQMCALLPKVLSPLQERITQVTRIVAEAIYHTGTTLTTAANAYVTADEDATTRHQSLLAGQEE